jgi:hypothetical protein
LRHSSSSRPSVMTEAAWPVTIHTITSTRRPAIERADSFSTGRFFSKPGHHADLVRRFLNRAASTSYVHREQHRVEVSCARAGGTSTSPRCNRGRSLVFNVIPHMQICLGLLNSRIAAARNADQSRPKGDAIRTGTDAECPRHAASAKVDLGHRALNNIRYVGVRAGRIDRDAMRPPPGGHFCRDRRFGETSTLCGAIGAETRLTAPVASAITLMAPALSSAD